MNTANKVLIAIAITVTGLLTGRSLAALADTSRSKPFAGVKRTIKGENP